jgi:hypothetical protein
MVHQSARRACGDDASIGFGQGAGYARRSATLLQDRDLHMLRSLADARLLTAEALEWLHFALWRTRYRRCMEQQSAPDAACYRPSSNLYRRLRGLCDAQYIQRVTRVVAAARTMFYRVPDAYGLTAAGAELLAAHYGVDATASITPRKRAIQNLDHAIAIGQLYAALRAELEYRGLRLTDWQGDYLLTRNAYDRIAIAGLRKPLPILPDATFVLADTRYFVEIDRGTRPLRSWADKVRAYAAYQQSVLLAARYQVTQFRVLIVAPTPVRLMRIAEEVVMVTRQPSVDYLFLCAEYVHPTTIRRGWQRIATIDWTTQRVVDRMVEAPTVMLAPHALWEQTI